MATATHIKQHHHGNGKLGSVRNEIADLRETVRGGVNDASEGGTRVLRAAGTAARDMAMDARDRAIQVRDRVGGTISERPFTSVAVAAGVGAALMGLAMMWRRR